MNVHKPPSIEVPVKIVDCLTSCIITFEPGSRTRSSGMKILRDERIFSEMDGSGSGVILSILKMYQSLYWIYNQQR